MAPRNICGSTASFFSKVNDALPNRDFCPLFKGVNLRLPHTPLQKQVLYVQQARNLHISTQLLKGNGGESHRIGVRWSNFINNIRMFGKGVKTLYKNIKVMTEYQTKHGRLKINNVAPSITEDGQTDILYSRKEIQFIYRVSSYHIPTFLSYINKVI